MNKLLSFITILFLLGCTSADIRNNSNTEKSLNALDAILYPAEVFFISIKESDFETSWELLSGKSKDRIIHEIYEASRDNGVEIDKDDISRSFRQNGVIAGNFWNAARSKFNPDMVLEESRWEFGFIKDRTAEITITHRKSSRPSKLKMYKENGTWRVGLVETFWSRRFMDLLFSFLRL